MLILIIIIIYIFSSSHARLNAKNNQEKLKKIDKNLFYRH